MTGAGAGSDADRLARVVLGRLVEPGRVTFLDAVTDLGPAALLDRFREEADLARRIAEIDPERELERAARLGLRFVVPGDAEWPTALDDLAGAEPVQERGGVPLGLWVRGPLRLDTLGGSVAVVGSRDATTYGDELARELAAAVSGAGRVVVSGAAFGVDQAAHRGALATSVPTVAVLACGADKAYPAKHAELIDRIAATGAVLSETVPGGAAMRVRFLTRNRLIAALTSGTVVVEAALRSGALSTAHWASRLHRPVMGVPGPVTSVRSSGVHELVRTGVATLVTSGAEVLEVVGASGEHLLTRPRGRDRPRDALSERQRVVLDAVPVARGASSASIARIVGLTTDSVHTTLLELEVRAMVEGDGSGWRLAALAHD